MKRSVEGPAAAVLVAARLTFCGWPGVSVRVDGVAVTPAGRPVSATDTGLENPLIAVAETVTVEPVAPLMVTDCVVGVTAREKSGWATATDRARVAVCDSVPDVPVNVTVLLEAVADEAASS